APGLDPAERQTRGVQTAAARAREHLADLDGILAESLADPLRLRAAVVVQVALRRTVIELRVRRIEAAGCIAVPQYHDGARCAHRVPAGFGRGGSGRGDAEERGEQPSEGPPCLRGCACLTFWQAHLPPVAFPARGAH